MSTSAGGPTDATLRLRDAVEGAVEERLDPVGVVGDDANEDPDDDELFDRLTHRLEVMGFLSESTRVGGAERAMMRTLATRDQPLADRVAFGRAHRGLARAVEAVLDSTYRRPTPSRRLQALNPVIAPLVQVLVAWILRRQTNQVFRHVRRLYELREANAEYRTDDHFALRRGRVQMQMICTDLGSGSFGLPVFLVSGAFISGLLSVGRTVIQPALTSRWLTVLLILVLVALFGLLAVIVLQSASIARKRLRLAFGVPLTELYTAIGSAGRPPADNCFLIAIVGLSLFALAAIIVPSGLFLLLSIH